MYAIVKTTVRAFTECLYLKGGAPSILNKLEDACRQYGNATFTIHANQICASKRISLTGSNGLARGNGRI